MKSSFLVLLSVLILPQNCRLLTDIQENLSQVLPTKSCCLLFLRRLLNIKMLFVRRLLNIKIDCLGAFLKLHRNSDCLGAFLKLHRNSYQFCSIFDYTINLVSFFKPSMNIIYLSYSILLGSLIYNFKLLANVINHTFTSTLETSSMFVLYGRKVPDIFQSDAGDSFMVAILYSS